MAPRKRVLEHVRRQLVASSDVVCGLSEGSIDDIPEATYVGHGVDHHWHDPASRRRPSRPTSPKSWPARGVRGRAVDALRCRRRSRLRRRRGRGGADWDGTDAARARARRQPAARSSAGRALAGADRGLPAHCDVGIVPHTDEPFTYSMEPHKAYNYAAAGLPTVTLNTAHAPALGAVPERHAGPGSVRRGRRGRDRRRAAVRRAGRDRALVHVGSGRQPAADCRMTARSRPIRGHGRVQHERYVAEALESALAQDYPADRLELIVVDDGSTDRTSEIVKGYAKRSGGRIRYVRQANAGPAAATTRGLQQARDSGSRCSTQTTSWLASRTRRWSDALGAKSKRRPVYGDMTGDRRRRAHDRAPGWTRRARRHTAGTSPGHLLRSNFVIDTVDNVAGLSSRSVSVRSRRVRHPGLAHCRARCRGCAHRAPFPAAVAG